MESANQNHRRAVFARTGSVSTAQALIADLASAADAIGDLRLHRRRILIERAASAIETQRNLLRLGDEPVSLPRGIVGDLGMLRRESVDLPDALAAQILRQLADEIRRLDGLVKSAM